MVTTEAQPSRFMAHHDCNAYCRGNRHAAVFWVQSWVEDQGEALRALCAALGAAFVHAELAKEATAEMPTTVGWETDGEEWPTVEDNTAWVAGATPWLLVWEEPS